MGIASSENNSYIKNWAELTYSDLFHRLGVPFIFRVYPSKRLSVLLNKGIIDGDSGRMEIGSELYPNTVRVEEPLFVTKIYLFSTDSQIAINSWEALIKSNHMVELRIGHIACEQILKSKIQEKRISRVHSFIQGIQRLSLNRTKLLCASDLIIEGIYHNLPQTHKRLRKVWFLTDSHIYLFFHKRHAKLAIRAASELKEMKRQGLIQRYQQIAKKNWKRR